MRLLSVLVIAFAIQSSLVISDPGQNTHNLVDYLSTNNVAMVSGKKILNKNLIVKTYSLNNNEYLWPDNYISEAMTIIRDSRNDGLLKGDYHYYKLLELINNYNNSPKKDSKTRAEIDILLTDGMLTYEFHLMNGKVSPEHIYKYWNYNHVSIQSNKIIRDLKKSIQQRTLKTDIDALRPHFVWYKRLQEELKRYRQLAERYPKESIPYTRTIRPGQSSANMPAIIKKLEQLGLVDKVARANPKLYSQDLVEPVKTYQRFHGLNPDGIIGKGTIADLNISYKDRVNQIKASLERGRWVADDLSKNYILVNIAGFKLFYFKDYKPIWSTEVIVGKEWSKTPVFTEKMKYIDFNPTWTVPRSMAISLLKKVKRDPDYLKEHNFIVKTSSGHVIDSDEIDWRSQNPNNFPYWLVQQPGANNALGRVKFMFPNSHSIYLHDTPAKQLFSKSSRSFSHGCIRVNHPFDLSLKILQNDQGFTEQEQEQILDDGKKETVFLKHPLNVFVMYWTASPESTGFYFYHDIYHRDHDLIQLLNTPEEKLLSHEISSL